MSDFEIYAMLFAAIAGVVIALIERRIPSVVHDRAETMQRKYDDLLERVVKQETIWDQYQPPGELNRRLLAIEVTVEDIGEKMEDIEKKAEQPT